MAEAWQTHCERIDTAIARTRMALGLEPGVASAIQGRGRMALAPTQGDLAVPRLRGNLGNYHVMRESKLGAGSYGVVYLGRVESAGSLRQRVALKFIVGVDGCPGAEHRAQHEADLLRMVEHPGYYDSYH